MTFPFDTHRGEQEAELGRLADLHAESEARTAELHRLRAAVATIKARHLAERAALVGIIDAANANPDPIHYKVREAIVKAREILRG
jgi:hypothetical protein